jgi:hypothetical protein
MLFLACPLPRPQHHRAHVRPHQGLPQDRNRLRPLCPGTKTDHELTFQLDHSVGAGHKGSRRTTPTSHFQQRPGHPLIRARSAENQK